MSSTDVVRAILNGEADDALDRVFEAYKTRHRQLREIRSVVMSASLRQGDTVRIGDTLRPQYLRGIVGEVVEVRDNRATIQLDEYNAAKAGRYSGRDRRLRGVPLSALQTL